MLVSGLSSAPRVSFIVPCFNEDPEILEVSLKSLLSQSFDSFECIVVDDSTNIQTSNKCAQICKSDNRFLYIHPPTRLGLAGSLNLGVELSRGEFVARFDSDDICSPVRLELQVDFLDKNPEVGVIGGSMEIINNSGILIGHRQYPVKHSDIVRSFIFSNAMAHPTVTLRKKILLVSGGAYDQTFRYAEDLELWLRLLNCNVKFANLSVPLVKYRQQFTNRNFDNWKYNIRARIKNLSSPYLFKKLLAICGIVIWMFLPKNFQRFIFQAISLRKN